MRNSILLASIAGAAVLTAVPAAAAPGDKVQGQFICVFKSGAVAKGSVRAEASRAASQGSGQVRHVYENSIRGFAASMSENAAQQLARRNANVAYCEQDQEVATSRNPMEFIELGKPRPSQPQQSTPWGIDRVNGGSSSSGATAWVIDSGVDLDHPDLNVNVSKSRNFVLREESPDDLNGHGTHVAGTIGARNNSIGVIGVVPGVEIAAVRVLNRRGSGYNSDVIAGVDYVAGAGRSGDVANMSLGGGVSQALDDAVVKAASGGVRFTLAAGNESESATLHSPARANGTNVYTVSSFAEGDRWSSFSNYDNPPVDYAEPGSSILSTYKDGGYATASGTSMAAPHLAGILLAGTVRADGTVTGDPDSSDDTIGVH